MSLRRKEKNLIFSCITHNLRRLIELISYFFHFPFQIPLTIPYAKCLHPLSGDIPKVSILSIPLERNSAKVECHEQKLLMPAG